MNVNQIPKELKQHDQWILWKLITKKDKKQTKVPFQLNGLEASPTNPKHWTSFEKALKALREQPTRYSGLGYVFSVDDPFVGIDLDKCVVNGELSDKAKEIVETFNSYTEWSQSKNGLHILVKGFVPGEKNRKGKYEIYDQSRFFVVTGERVEGTPAVIEERQPQVKDFYNRFIEKEKAPKSSAASEPMSPKLEDDIILNIAYSAANSFKFIDIFEGNWSEYYSSQSEADQALCNMLAFYTQDPEQIDRLFRQSKLMRDKWERDDYREHTIDKAISGLTAWYSRGFETGDLGNAQRLIHYYGQDLRFCHTFKSWFVWDGTRWKQDETGQAVKLAATIGHKIHEEIARLSSGDEGIEKVLYKQAHLAKSKRGIDAMLSLAAPHLPVTPDELDEDAWLLNVKNGVIDLKTGQLLPHNREQLMTRMAPVVFKPEADCKRWKQFLTEIVVDDLGVPLLDDIRFLQKAFGYALTGRTSEHVFFILHGSGRNGKGTMANIFFKLLGDYAQAIQAESLLARKFGSGSSAASPDIAKLKGTRYVIASESDFGRRLDEAKVKQMTGGDPITCRFLHQNEMTYTPQFKIFFNTNYLPNIEGSDKGIWDRVRRIDFTRYVAPEERDMNLPEKLWAESSGILNWAIEGCLMWQREGLRETETMKAARESFRSDMDPLSTYVEDRLVISADAMVKPTALRNDYQTWCFENDEYQFGKKVFNEKLEAIMRERGVKLDRNARIDGGKTRVFKGVGLLNSTSEFL